MSATTKAETISTVCDYHQWTDFAGPRELEVFAVDGHRIVGVRVCPRGFANETVVHTDDADSPQGVDGLMDYFRRAHDAPVGDGYHAQAMTRDELRRWYFAHR